MYKLLAVSPGIRRKLCIKVRKRAYRALITVNLILVEVMVQVRHAKTKKRFSCNKSYEIQMAACLAYFNVKRKRERNKIGSFESLYRF